MGAYLDTPNTEKFSEHAEHRLCSYGATTMQGWRCGQEDAHISEEIDLDNGKKAMLFAVFDGHGGKEVAAYAKDRYPKCI